MDQAGRKSLPHEVPLSVDAAEANFFLTICLKDRAAASLIKKDTAERLLGAIRFYQEQRKWWVHVAVVMPDHVHLLASFPDKMTATVREWKRWTSHDTGVRWLRGFFDHRIREDESFREKADYILMNPVRAGLVERWEEWPHRWMA